MISGRRRSVIFFTVLGICLVVLAVTLNVSWVVLNWRRGVLAVLGVIFFLLIIAGMVLNTIFLVREIRRNEQHDSFINAVTHELKTPVASIRLYLQTLQTRELDEDKRREFYRIMLEDSDRLLHTIEQVLRAGSAGSRLRRGSRARASTSAEIARECVELARTRFHLDARGAGLRRARVGGGTAVVLGDADELKAAVWNLLDNAVKYSPRDVQRRASSSRTLDGRRLAVRVTDQRRRHFAGRAEADLPALLPHSRAASRSGQGQRPRPVHRPLGRPQARRPRVRRERGRRPGQHVHAAAAASAAAHESSQRMLIVEDEQHLADGLRFNLEAEGYDVEVVDTGEAALERLLGAGARPLRSRRARRDAARQGRLRRRVGAARRRGSSCRC